ncbi:MAG: DUF11 domain-containing protein [Alphaproteobacteria bacterium]|nr:DUF11 domain-containing protein [Alphaproteobacteria bacterium]
MHLTVGNIVKSGRKALFFALSVAGGLALTSVPVHAAGTLAGTTINNTATATYTDSTGKSVTVPSNTVAIVVDEILNNKVVAADPGYVTTSAGATNAVMSFTVTNTGNGKEAIKLTPNGNVGGGQFNPSPTSIVLDTNNNGVYDPGVDTVYIAGSNDPVLAPDSSIRVFVLSSIPGSAVNGNLGIMDLTGADVVGSGKPGTVFAGKGNGGVDAVVGASGATSTGGNDYIIQQATVAFVKSATILDPFGGNTPVPGAVITYALAATVNGTGSLSGLTVTDVVPPNTSYQPGSMTLQGVALTDAADTDPGTYSPSTGISVALGTVPAGQTRTVTFKVTIN